MRRTWKLHGRRRPYTATGVRRLPCFRCGRPAVHQWIICADGLYRPICPRCDVALNALALKWLRHPAAARLSRRYRAGLAEEGKE